MNIFPKSLYLINDLRFLDVDYIFQKITGNTYFSLSYVMLLIASSVVCTLGLLVNSSPVVIGGMIISPLMWPLIKISVGISYSLPIFVRHAFTLLIFSILISLVSAIGITYLSPIKVINAEIILRTNPTLLDIFVALAAGGIAAIAIMEKRISDSFAGVAVATSLMPPLCVSGIGLALFDLDIFSRSFLLFAANVVSIVFVSLAIFLVTGLRRKGDQSLAKKGLFVITLTLIVTAIPLIFFLQNYSLKTNIYQKVQKVLTGSFQSISPTISVRNIKTTVDTSGQKENFVTVQADVIVPEELTLDYEQKQTIIGDLERELGRKIELNLNIQKSLSLVSEEQVRNGQIKKKTVDQFSNELASIDSSIKIDSLTLTEDKKTGSWNVDAVLRADPSIVFTETEREKIEKSLKTNLQIPIALSIDIVPRIKLKSIPDVKLQEIRDDVQAYLTSNVPYISVSNITVKEISPDSRYIEVIASVSVPEGTTISDETIQSIKIFIANKYNKLATVTLQITEKKILEF